MNVVSLNANKGLVKHLPSLAEMDVILGQEPYPHAVDHSERAAELFPNHHVTATRYLVTISREAHEVLHLSESLIVTQHSGGVILGNVYIHPGRNGGHRAAQLERILAYVSHDSVAVDLMAGDWNMAPTIDDGWNGRDHSTYTTKRERVLFKRIEQATGLQDLGSLIRWASTFEQHNRGKLIAFRCDLALANQEVWSLDYDHTTRTGPGPADHSMLVLRRGA